MGRLGRTWELAKASGAVLRQDKELAVLPLLSAVCTIGVALAFIAPLLLVGNDLSNGAEELDPGPMGYVLLFFGYLVVTFVGVFFNGALVSGAYERLRGGDPTLGSAMRGAGARFHRLAPWALVSATVGLILGQLENYGVIGNIVRSIFDLAWRLITFLTVPILIIEDIGPIDGLKRSATLFKKTWGENMAAQFGFGLVGFIAMLPGLAIGGLLVGSGTDALVAVGVVVMVVSVVTVAVVISALSGIFQTALYLYAAEGTVVPEFASTGLETAFRPK